MKTTGHGAMSSKSECTRTLGHLLTNQTLLCTVPILVIVVVASLDNADKQLLASSFPMLEKSLGLDVQTLGYFSLFTNLSYALSLPLWGYLLHAYGFFNIHILLSGACFSWGIATVGIAISGSSVVGQAVFRAMVGVALGSILPLSQTMLVELVETKMRGRAFGFMGLCEKLAGTLATASVIYLDNWTHPYYCLGLLSIAMSFVVRSHLDPKRIPTLHATKESTASKDKQVSLRQIVQRIAKIPTFVCLVAQGVFGGTPWDMMSFLLLLLDWRGFTKEQIVSIQFSLGISATIGGWLGGVLGDYAEQRVLGGTQGRIVVAIVSVMGGIPLYGLFLFAKDYRWALIWINLFHIVATWTTAGALRPLCAALTHNPSERAQIVSMWIVLQKSSGAVFGAPLVGYLTSRMMTAEELQEPGVSHEKAHALALNLFVLSTLFWIICASFWIVMACTLNNDKYRQRKAEGGDNHQQTDNYKKDDFEMAPLV